LVPRVRNPSNGRRGRATRGDQKRKISRLGNLVGAGAVSSARYRAGDVGSRARSSSAPGQSASPTPGAPGPARSRNQCAARSQRPPASQRRPRQRQGGVDRSPGVVRHSPSERTTTVLGRRREDRAAAFSQLHPSKRSLARDDRLRGAAGIVTECGTRDAYSASPPSSLDQTSQEDSLQMAGADLKQRRRQRGPRV
jgi:hypothetical protein